MKSIFGFAILLSIFAIIDFAAGNIVRAAKCDVSQAYSILEALSTGSSFCSSLLHVSTVSTKSKTTTITVTGDCTSATKTKTEHATFTSTVYGKTTTLPTITLTEYSSTILVPSGPAPTINKRSPQSVTADNRPKSSTTTPTTSTKTTTTTTTSSKTTSTTTSASPLSGCPSETISSACSSLICPSPTTITSISTKAKKCTDTTTITSITTDHTTTTKIPYQISPPPVIVTSPGVLTTTVPAACASQAYNPGGNGVGNQIIPLGYPYFPQTGVECCVICFTQQNCIASAVIYGDDADTIVAECDLLIHVNGTQPGVSSLCPLGVQDYPFGSPQASGNVYPGPCGT